MAGGTAKLPVELPGGKEAGETMNNLIKSAVILNREMKNLAVGSHEFAEKASELKEVNNKLAEIREQTKGVSEASKELKDHFVAMFPIAREFQEIGEKISGVGKSVGGLSSSFGGLKSAIAATGIGALILGLTALYGWLNRTNEGAIILDTGWRTLENTWDILLAKLRTPITSFLEWADRPITNTYNGIKKIIEASNEMAEASFKLQKAQLSANEEIAKSDLAAQDLLKQSRNVADSFDVRIKKVREAGEEQKKGLAIRQEITDKEIEFINKEIEESKENNEVTEVSIALQKKLSDAIVNKTNLEKESILIGDRINNQEDSLIKQRDQKAAEAEAKEKSRRDKAIAEHEKEYNEQREAAFNIEQIKIDVMEKGIEREIAQIQLDAKRKMAALKGSDEQIVQQTLLLMGEEDKKIADAKKKAADEQNKIVQDQLKKDVKALDDFYKKQEEDGKREIELKKRTAEVEKKLAEVRYQTEKEVVDGFGELLVQNASDEEKAKEIKKVGGSIDVGLNLQRELASNAATAAANPLNAVTFGAAGAAELVALDTAAYVRAAVAEAKILAFEQGGIPDGVLRGPSHAEGGIPLVAEGNEIILTKGVYNDPGLRSLASALNQAGGGRSFAPPIDPSSRGSVASVIGAAGGGIGPEHIEGLKQTIIGLSESMDKRIDRIESHINLQAVDKGLKQLYNLRGASNV